MPLSRVEAQSQARDLYQIRQSESKRLQQIDEYLRDDPDRKAIEGLPSGAPADVVRLARISRVNLLKYIVNARVQGLWVEGFQTPQAPDNAQVWQRVWQPNQLDARQIGVHRAALAYGAAYVTVLPGAVARRPRAVAPVVRGVSPLKATVAYGDDDMWPVFALEQRRGGWWRLIDAEAVYWLRQDGTTDTFTMPGTPQPHGATWGGEPVCPVVRFRESDDLDHPVRGVVEPHFALQDQINITTFGLQVAQHFGAFRQRYIIGWLAENQKEAQEMGAARLMVIPPDATGEDGGDTPTKIQVGEFAQTELRGYLESRQSSARHLAITAQVPVNDLLGDVTNVGAVALEALRASYYAAVDENQVMLAESWEQVLGLGGEMIGEPPDPSASVIWRDTRIRSMSEAAEALGTLAEKLLVPPQALWSRIPGVPQHEREMWASTQQSQGSDLDRMVAAMSRQAAGERTAESGLILPAGA